MPTEYRLFSVERSLPHANPPHKQDTKRTFPVPEVYATRWQVEIPIYVRAMVKTGKTLFVAGPQKIIDEFEAEKRLKASDPKTIEQMKKQAEIYAGSSGSVLTAVSSTDGATLRTTAVDVLPIFDGMIASGGQLVVATDDGRIVCLK